jgi:hypothetical protein
MCRDATFLPKKGDYVAMFELGRLVHRPVALIAAILAVAVLSDPSGKPPNKRIGLLPPEARSFMALYGADAVTINRAARDFIVPDQIEWKPRQGGGQTAMVFGDPSKAGLYLELLKRPPNDWSQPHSHANDRFITVVAGTMLIGTGARQDRSNTVRLGPGSFVRDVANQMHYDGTGPDGLTIEIMGMGPATATRAETK